VEGNLLNTINEAKSMPLKKPSELFQSTESTSVVEEVIDENVEINTFSEAFHQFKSNLKNIDTLSSFSESLSSYNENIEKINEISEHVNHLKEELKTYIKREDLEKSILSQLLVFEQCIHKIEEKIEGINQEQLDNIKSIVENISSEVNSFLESDVPRYKKLVVDSELRTSNRFDKLKSNVNDILEKVSDLVNQKYNEILEVVDDVNKQAIDEIFSEFQKLQEELPNHRKFIVDSELKTESKISSFDKKLTSTINIINQKIDSVEGVNEEITTQLQEKINSVTDLFKNSSSYIKEIDSYKNQITEKVTELETQIKINESHIKKQNKNIDLIQEEVFNSIKKLNLDEIEQNNYKLSKKIKYLEEILENFNEERILSENIVSEPPETKNSDPLTPLNKNYVTLEQLQEHYRLFINRVQQQLASIGGGGETRLKYLDDIVGIATNPSAYDGKFLKYDHSIKKFEFVTVEGGGTIDPDNITTGSISILDNDSGSDYSGQVVSLQKTYTAVSDSTNPVSIHKVLSVEEYSTIDYTIQATNGLDFHTVKILGVNNGSLLNKVETNSVSTGSTFVSYDLNIEDNFINLVAIPTTSNRIVYSILYTAIAVPYRQFIISTDDDNIILTEDDQSILIQI
jgi:chromosome segregation ATPase